jgi:hypothetical protein
VSSSSWSAASRSIRSTQARSAAASALAFESHTRRPAEAALSLHLGGVGVGLASSRRGGGRGTACSFADGLLWRPPSSVMASFVSTAMAPECRAWIWA